MRSRLAVVAILAMLVVLPLAGSASAAPAAAPDGGVIPGQFIVVVQPGADPVQVAREHGAAAHKVYKTAARGFAAALSPGQVAALKSDSRVNNVLPDQEFRVLDQPDRTGKPIKPTPTPTPVPTPPPTTQQVVPTGIDRVDAEGAGSVENAGFAVAVIDTGISPLPDLNLAGSVTFVSGGTADQYGHGTHVAGTIGAKNNDFGVVGVAPGVPLYNVKVCGAAGTCRLSSIIAGIDWVTKNAAINRGDRDTEYQIKVANMSLGGPGTDDGNCGVDASGRVVDAYHQAICDSTKAGVVYAVAAGNESDNAANHTPAAYDEVITVSAIADFNGKPGGGAAATCRSGVDDTFADFSNYGPDVDIAAPGVCILSTYKDGSYRYLSGTSMATPHVTGAVALLISQGLTIPSGDSMGPRDAAMSKLSALAKEAGSVYDGDLYFTDDSDSNCEPLLNLGLSVP